MDSRLFIEALAEFNGRLIRLMESLSAIRELSCIDVCRRDPELLLNDALRVFMEYQHFERCSVFMRQGGVLVNVAGMNWDELFNRNAGKQETRTTAPAFQMGEGIVGICAETGEIQHCRNCVTDMRFRSSACGENALQGSIIAVPIHTENELFGVLNVYYPHPYHFNAEHERFFSIFSRILGQLLVNNRYVNQLDHLVGERTRELEKALGEAKDLKLRFEQISVIDELTELYNRRFFFPEAEAALARAVRYERAFSLMMIDVDHFKVVNDTFGHAMGDRVLKDVAAVFKRESRAGDILARYGGEEFVYVLDNTDVHGAELLAERMRERVMNLEWEGNARTVIVTVSIGIATLARDAQDSTDIGALLETLLHQADKALYQCKMRGRNGVCVYGEL